MALILSRKHKPFAGARGNLKIADSLFIMAVFHPKVLTDHIPIHNSRSDPKFPHDIGALDMLIHTYSESEVDTLAQSVKGLANDYEAVKNSLIYGEISNGPIEGVNSRIKAIHRRSSGRAGIFLLNAYMVLSS